MSIPFQPLALKPNHPSISHLCILAAALIGFLCSCATKSTPSVASRDLLFQRKLRSGDLVFRKGRSMVSNLVMMSDPHGSYSHVGIVVVENRKVMVVHITPGENATPNTPDVIKKESLHTFFGEDKATAGCAMRCTKARTAEKKISQRTYELLNRELCFDSNYNLEDTTKMYCTELIWNIYKSAGINLVNNHISIINLPLLKGPVILPSDVASNPTLKVIAQF